MKLRIWILLPFLLLACSKKRHQNMPLPPPHSPEQSRMDFDKSESFLILNAQDNSPLANATILIGTEPGKEFVDNQILTDENGSAVIPADWTEALPVTIFKDGFVSQTHLNRQPEALVAQLSPLAVATQRRAFTGSVSGFGTLKKDGFIDFGLVIPSFTLDSLLNLDLSKMISPELSAISILGFTFSLPTNISLPRQSESYSFIPFTLEKPQFKIFLESAGKQFVSTSRGRFDFRKLSDKINGGKSYFEVANDFQFSAFGIHGIDATTSQGQLATPTLLNQSVPFNPSLQIPNRLLYGLAIVNQQNLYSVVDIKMKSTPVPQLQFPAQGTKNVLLVSAALEKAPNNVNKIAEGVSSALVETSQVSSALLLDPIAKPRGSSEGVQTRVPSEKLGIQPRTTKFVLSNLDIQMTTEYYLEQKSAVWEVFADGWVPEVQLPKLGNHGRVGLKRWDVIYFGQAEGAPNATHMVRNSIDF